MAVRYGLFVLKEEKYIELFKSLIKRCAENHWYTIIIAVKNKNEIGFLTRQLESLARGMVGSDVRSVRGGEVVFHNDSVLKVLVPRCTMYGSRLNEVVFLNTGYRKDDILFERFFDSVIPCIALSRAAQVIWVTEKYVEDKRSYRIYGGMKLPKDKTEVLSDF